ncbi:MAG: 4Fe-4S binding protein [Lachnospiraceae bacterium]|nr:4Fe-4S binding protein [Lachnospiraceae bacterium]
MSTKIMEFAKTALKNMFKEPATLNYPAEPREYPERTRGHIVIDINECIFCGMCMRNCPPRAITVDRAKGTWTLNRFDCIQCNYCSTVCPKKCLKIVPGYTEPAEEKAEFVVNRPGGPLPTPKPKAAPKAAAKPAAKATEGTANKNKKKKVLPKHYYTSNITPVPHNNIDECVYCAMCARNCPVRAITVDRATKLWEVNEGLCVDCGQCETNCPKKCIELKAGSNYYLPDGTPTYDLKEGLEDTTGASKEEAAEEAGGAEAGGVGKVPTCNVDDCIFCGACAGGCPAGAITVDAASGTWKVDENACVSCGACVSACPQGVISL